ncbi:MAG: hypothetical protein K0S76_1979 [Herbinix sp.]|jgi:hypothetical protein|nr:hypothetical protein [Herbinix sp.]
MNRTLLLVTLCSLLFVGCKKPSEDTYSTPKEQEVGETVEDTNSDAVDKVDTDYKEFFKVQEINVKPVDKKYLTEDYMEGIDYNPTRQLLDETEDGLLN